MAQEHQEENSVDVVSHTVKRKRGRPRKDEILGSEPSKRNRRARIDGEGHGADPFIGQVVSGVLDGRFDAGYMLTVQVGGGGCVLRGVVFEPGLSVPISSANDVAPDVKMFQRNEVSLPSSAWQPPSYTPARSVARRDGACRSRSRSESTTVVEDLNANNVQMNPSADTARSPGKCLIQACGNLKLEDLQSPGSDNNTTTIDGLQSSLPADVDLPASIPKVVHDANPITPEPKKEAASEDPPIFGNNVEAADLQEAVCDTEQTVQTLITKPLLHAPETPNGSNTAHQCEMVGDVNLVEKAAVSNAEPSFRNGAEIDAENVQTRASAPEQPAEAFNPGPSTAHLQETSLAEASDHGGPAEASHAVDGESAQLPEVINGAEPVTEIPAAEASHTGQSADTSLGDTAVPHEFKQSAADEESTNLPGDAAEIVGVHPHQEELADEPKTAAEQSAEPSDGGPPAQLSEVATDAKPVAEVSQSGDSQSQEGADSGHDLSNVTESKQPSDPSGRGRPGTSEPAAELSKSEEACEPSIDGADLGGDTKSPNLCGVVGDAEPPAKSKEEDDNGEASPLDETFDLQNHLEVPSEEVTAMAAPGKTESPLGPEDGLPSLPTSGIEEEPPASSAAAAVNAGLS